MSYDLCFWKQAPTEQAEARAIYEILSQGQIPDSLLPFPVDEFIAAVAAAFPSTTQDRSGNQLFWLGDDKEPVFEMYCSPVHAIVSMRPLDGTVANRLIDFAVSFGAPLYDPQTNERFALE